MISYTKYNLVNDLGFVKTGVDNYSSIKKYFSTGASKKIYLFLREVMILNHAHHELIERFMRATFCKPGCKIQIKLY